MKATLLLILGLSAYAAVNAQAPATPPAAPAAGQLKPEQAASVLKQLEDLEKSILAQRGSNLSGIIQRIRTAASSDAAAMGFIADCDKVVNVDRKVGDRQAKEDAERRKEQQKKQQENVDKEDLEKNGDALLAFRLSLEFLALTLEAQETKDLSAMIPKLQTYHQTLIASAEKLKGRSGEILTRGFGGGGDGGEGGGGRRVRVPGNLGLVVEAFQLEPFVQREGWPRTPGDILEHYQTLMIPLTRAKDPEKLAATWDAAITAEATYRKARMFEGEYAIWLQSILPDLRWERAVDMASSTNNPVIGMAEMLNVIKANPTHPAAPTWLASLRSMVEKDQGTTK